MEEHHNFLKRVAEFNGKYASINIGGKLESIAQPFWSWEEIQKGLSLREEWDVPLHLIPFQGDWHDLFCLNKITGEIVSLNDARESIFVWENGASFIASLSDKEITNEKKPQIVSAWFSPDLLEKANEFEKK